jgi:hypothetical protein
LQAEKRGVWTTPLAAAFSLSLQQRADGNLILSRGVSSPPAKQIRG